MCRQTNMVIFCQIFTVICHCWLLKLSIHLKFVALIVSGVVGLSTQRALSRAALEQRSGSEGARARFQVLNIRSHVLDMKRKKNNVIWYLVTIKIIV
ncbi:LOW QUALITY PROTEIN: hypothetical protein KUTeg_015187 [Tegillarca granosa]|uniref:Secreted protein n=1 Tax=Tegillarca granosa TaxID=220873 RepID=A0ABQ9EPD7_TEGGR|nr:LOW QUALITY PROTEIN: hypothetical protein KUTeg_015187 [Tegillarca granosa]